MKFLAEENFPWPAVCALREHGFEVAWLTEESPGLADEQVLARCVNQKLILLTLDKDFGELVFQRGLPLDSGVVLFRVEAESPAQFTQLVLAALRSREDWSGFFSVITSDRIRMILLSSSRTRP
jgi:predicted nuclease of predicted toxin-antitoxin system